MKVKYFLVLCALAVISLPVFFYFNSFFVGKNSNNIVSKSYNNYENIGNIYNGNYVYTGASNLVFNQLKDKYIDGNVRLENGNQKAKNIIQSFNSEFFTTNDLDSNSYYIKSGFGQNTVDIINKESREKFPNKSFKDLDIKISEDNTIFYSYFYKDLKFKKDFNECDKNFKGVNIKAFCGNKLHSDNIDIVKYFDKNKFIVKLKDENNNDEIFLMNGYDMSDPDYAVADVQKYSSNIETYSDGFNFMAPKINISNYSRQYNDIIGVEFFDKNLIKHRIDTFYENINLNLDNKGAKAESQAVLVTFDSIANDTTPKKPVDLYFDKDYFIVMKQKNSNNPYIVLGITNTEFMNRK